MIDVLIIILLIFTILLCASFTFCLIYSYIIHNMETAKESRKGQSPDNAEVSEAAPSQVTETMEEPPLSPEIQGYIIKITINVKNDKR